MKNRCPNFRGPSCRGLFLAGRRRHERALVARMRIRRGSYLRAIEFHGGKRQERGNKGWREKRKKKRKNSFEAKGVQAVK